VRSRALVTLLAVVLAVLVLPASPASAAPALPPGFVLTERNAGLGPSPLTSFALLPDGGLLTTGKDGRVVWRSADDTQTTQLRQIPVWNTGDVGLLDIELGHDFATSRTVYTVYTYRNTAGEGWHRLSAWTLELNGAGQPTALGSERIVLDGIRADEPFHGLNDVEVGSDGTLWLAMGDASHHAYVDPRSLRALDLDQPHGKILRIRPDGRGVAANPHYSASAPSSWRSRVYADGLRSPWKMTLSPQSGTPVMGDVGWNSFEEVNVVNPGASYGWPCWEGPNRTPGHRDTAACQGVGHTPPVHSYPRSGGGSITGGVFYTGDRWPSQYRGAYLFGDYVSQRIWAARFNSDGTLAAPVADFGSSIGRPVKFASAPNGDVLYADIGTGKVKRLSYVPGNRAPTARFTTTTDRATRTVSFDASQSSDLDGDRLTYSWNFGDGTTGTGVAPRHTYPASPSAFDVTLTVTDVLGATGTVTQRVYPTNAVPRLTVAEPRGSMPDGTFAVGEAIELTASALDTEDGDLAQQVQWAVDLYHCRGTVCHSHPGATGTGRTFSTTFDDHGGETSFLVRASVTDSAGARVERTVTARPALRRLTVRTSPPAAVTVNGEPATEILATVGSRNSITAAPTALDGVSQFVRWSDGSTSRSRTLTMGTRDTALSATYLSPIAARYAVDPTARSVLGAPVGAEQGEPTARWQVYERGRMYWSPTTGARLVHGDILRSYLAAGGHSRLGLPLTDELPTPDGVGRFNHFANGASVYWTSRTGAHAVYGAIRARWAATGWERGPLGYPITSETGTPDGVGRYNHFSKGGSVYWTPATGAQAVWGAIRSRWAATGWERGPLGYPRTSELATPDGVGRFTHFSGSGGSIYWSPTTGAHEVYGLIRARWAELGWERGYLGYPVSGEYAVPGGRRSDFRGGSITWTPETGAVDRRR
jgi:glucose/arabinose dehydrogenase